LRPIKRKQISEKVAERLNLSAETVDEIVSCYYSSIQRMLSNLEFPNITVQNLGIFHIKRNALEKKLDAYRKSLVKYEAIVQPNMSEFKSIMDLKHNITRYEKALEELDKSDKQKLSKQEEKLIYKKNKL